MKLKSKHTGKIMEFDAVLVAKDVKGNGVAHLEYDSIQKFTDQWEDYEEPENHWYINYQGEVYVLDPKAVPEYSRNAKEIGNYFETKEEAEKALEKLKAWKRLEDKGISLHLQKQFRGDGIGYSRTIYTDFTKDSQEIVKDLDLLFGGEE